MTIKKILSDAHIEIDINLGWYSENKRKKGDLQGFTEDLKREAKNIKDFLRDHRSIDIHDVYVIEEYEYRCEHCGYITKEDNAKTECCEESIREWATPIQLIEFGYEIL